MYTISKDPDGIVLLCHNCSHVERVSASDKNIGSPRTQAARAMQIHAREKHGAGLVLPPVPKEDILIAHRS
jgi:hypothetical protein